MIANCHRIFRFLFLTLGLLTGLFAGAGSVALAGDPFSLSGNWNYQKNGSDDGQSSSFDQGYSLNGQKEISQFIGLSGSVRYNANRQDVGGETSTISPTLSLDINNDLFSGSLNTSASQVSRDEQATTMSRTWGGTVYSVIDDYPGIRLFYNESYADDEARPARIDSESTNYGGSIDYNFMNFDFLYDYRFTRSDDRLSGTAAESVDQLGQVKWSDTFLDNRLAVSASHQYSHSRAVSLGGASLLPLNILAAASGAGDATTPVNSFDEKSALNDRIRDVSAGVNVAAFDVDQAMIIEVGLNDRVSRLWVYLDQELFGTAPRLFGWDFWRSDDGLVWTRITDMIPAVHSPENNRSRFLFDFLTKIDDRFIKIIPVWSGGALADPVFVTEIEVEEILEGPPRVNISQQSEISVSVRPNEQWQVGYNIRRGESRREGGSKNIQWNQSLNVGFFPTDRSSVAMSVSQSRDQAAGSAERMSRNYAISASTELLPTLNFSVGYTRSEAFTGGEQQSTSDNFDTALNASLYPDLTASLTGSWSQTEARNGTTNSSSGYSINASARVTPRLDLNLSGKYSESSSEQSTPAGQTRSDENSVIYGFNSNYRPSDLLVVSSGFNRNEDKNQNQLNASVSLLATDNLQADFSLFAGFGNESSRQYDSSLNWLLNRHLSLQGNASYATTASGDLWSLSSSVNANF